MKKKWGKLVALVTGVIMTGSLIAGCGATQNSNEILIGANYELTGNIANFGKQAVNGINLAFKQVNEQGGVNGKKIKLIVADNKSEASAAVTKLITTDKCKLVFGAVSSSNVLAAVPIAEANKIPLVTATATNPKVTVENGQVKPYTFRTCFIDPSQGKIMSEFARKSLNTKT